MEITQAIEMIAFKSERAVLEQAASCMSDWPIDRSSGPRTIAPSVNRPLTMPNRLASETSPYLLQHQENPVDWYPQGKDALARARNEDRPILLSIGYAACHWCHVMAHESFEDEETAQLMNELFVNIKVDREERPDLRQHLYAGSTGAHRSWRLADDGLPHARRGALFRWHVLPPGEPPENAVIQACPAFGGRCVCKSERRESRAPLSSYVRSMTLILLQAAPVSSMRIHSILPTEHTHRDTTSGTVGSEGRPSFRRRCLSTSCCDTGSVQVRATLEMVTEAFRKMARGGLYSQIGGGFHRYTVDAIWLVHHFEKMLYDNALLVRLGAHLWRERRRIPKCARVTSDTATWLRREMTSPNGGFYSSLDADEDTRAGFYVWTEQEIDSLLGDDAALVKNYLGITARGNFGKNIPNVAVDVSVTASRNDLTVEELHRRITAAKATLYGERAKRVWPGQDEKILASWNGLMLQVSPLPREPSAIRSSHGLLSRTGSFCFARWCVTDV